MTVREEDGSTHTFPLAGIRHTKYPIYGLQFHPESILTPMGNEILKNFFFAL